MIRVLAVLQVIVMTPDRSSSYNRSVAKRLQVQFSAASLYWFGATPQQPDQRKNGASLIRGAPFQTPNFRYSAASR